MFKLKPIGIASYEERREGEILSSSMEFKKFDDVAYLNPGPFSSTAESGEEKFRSFIDSVFAEIKELDPKALIIDLRNNPGGHNACSDYLISYFADKAFKWHSDFRIKTSEILKEQTRKNNDTSDTYFRRILREESGTVYSYDHEAYEPQPEEARFKNQVYVLVNRQSHSMSAVAAATIQDYDFGTIVGEETGDLPSLYASQFSFKLPQTGILIKIPKGYMTRPNGSTRLEGVIPDIMIRDHLLDENDEILEGLLERIKNER